MSCLVVKIARAVPELAIVRNSEGFIKVNILRQVLSVVLSKTCRNSVGANLSVYPPEMVWLTEDNNYSAQFEVVSNIEWTIDY